MYRINSIKTRFTHGSGLAVCRSRFLQYFIDQKHTHGEVKRVSDVYTLKTVLDTLKI